MQETVKSFLDLPLMYGLQLAAHKGEAMEISRKRKKKMAKFWVGNLKVSLRFL